MKRVFGATCSLALCCGWLIVPAAADIFSIDRASPSARQFHQAHLLSPGPLVHVLYGNLGLKDPDDLDALSQGLDVVRFEKCPDIIYFSVDRPSSLPPSDTYVTVKHKGGVMWCPVGFNDLDVPAVQFGLDPRDDNLDAYSMEEFDYSFNLIHDVDVYFSVDAKSPSWPSGADILVAPPGRPFQVFKPFGTMGLMPEDDIDALALTIGSRVDPPQADRAYFSLARGSPTLKTLGASPADVFYTLFDGKSRIAYKAALLGLRAEDNVDALETNPVPEPSSMLLLVAGVVVAGRRR